MPLAGFAVTAKVDLPFVSPLCAGISQMASTLLVCAEVHPFFDESVEYQRRVEAAGVAVDLEVYQACSAASGPCDAGFQRTGRLSITPLSEPRLTERRNCRTSVRRSIS